MSFNSLDFLIFLPFVLGLYWIFEKKKQNLLLVLASYFFYGWWDSRFLLLIFLSTVIDFWAGYKISNCSRKNMRRFYLGFSLLGNLGCLAFFKYYNFFSHSLASFLSSFGVQSDFATLNIILPVGISFYTFQTLSYTLDIYRKNLKPTRDFIAFAAFVSFFPQLVAGPIERAGNLLPQFTRKRCFSVEESSDALRLILWGYFKKVVIADNLALIVEKGYPINNIHGGMAIVATYAFAFQIYADFSAYSNIARGLARLFGFKLMINFKTPYFSSSPVEFWKRWHISLSTWFRDYVYIPLGGNRSSKNRHRINLIITFLTSGLWHGANSTFLAWGLFHGLLILPFNQNKRKKKSSSQASPLKKTLKVFFTFHLILIGWVLFRGESLAHCLNLYHAMFTWLLNPESFIFKGSLKMILLLLLMLLLEFITQHRNHPLEVSDWSPLKRWALEFIILFLILFFGQFRSQVSFIYFQF
jgi:D-alanyl-lipoteichoic acid acyltransferase DltB (MBOAT superfamily)